MARHQVHRVLVQLLRSHIHGRIYRGEWTADLSALGPCTDAPYLQIVFSAFTRNGGLTTSLVSAALTLLAQLNGIVSVTLPYFLVVIGWVRFSSS